MKDIYNYYNHLGARIAYCHNGDPGKGYCGIGDAVAGLTVDKRVIDPVGVLGVLMKNYPLADRTMIQGVSCAPWFSRPTGDGGWECADLPRHGTVTLSPDKVAEVLKTRLCQEAKAFTAGKSTIGILLSGGMDSRIVAATVRQLQLNGEFTGQVVALTWGDAGSRDVVYAQRIAQKFGWDFLCYPLTAELLQENILLAGQRGAEYSPVHLHAMSKVAEVDGVDGILAGSYGDSIGRGEYSGRRKDRLPSILSRHLNHFAFLLRDVEVHSLSALKQDLELSRNRFPGRSESDYREIEMQMHYMRRQLNSCMAVIDDRVPLYQMFGHPEVFGFMWSLDPSCRTDDVYQHLLARLPGDLLDIPWARTGRTYNKKDAVVQDDYAKLNNHYGRWLRNDCRSFVLEKLTSGVLQSLGIFNDKALDLWVKKWPKTNDSKADRLDEKMAWLASLAVFADEYNVTKNVDNFSRNFWRDYFHERKALLHTYLYYQAKKLL